MNLESGDPEDHSTSNMKVAILISDEDLRAIEEDYLLIDKNSSTIKVRDTLLPFEANNQINTYDLIRYLEAKKPALFKATDSELWQCLPSDLPKLMQIDNWNHQPYSKHKNMISPSAYVIEETGTKPSKNETYKLIADILVTKDTTKWKPTLPPNNDWKNWPRAGGF